MADSSSLLAARGPLASTPAHRIGWGVVAVILIVAWFGGLGSRALQHPDEGRYAEIAREMVVTGDFVTPRLEGLKYFEKPPLQYWLMSATFRLAGPSDWSARLVPAISGLLSVAIVGLVLLRLGNDALGATYAALVLASSVMHVVISHLVTLDALFTAWLTAAMGCFLLAQRDGMPASRVRCWMAGAYACVALATLTKGLAALVIFGVPMVVYTAITRDTGPWRRAHVSLGVAIVLAIAAPWFLLVSAANPEFASFFFVREHLQRFLTNVHAREGAWWYFVPIFAAGTLPWLGVVLVSPRGPSAPRNANGFRWTTYCLVWAVVVFVFFSASRSKLPSYILPMLPPLAMVVGWRMGKLAHSDLMRVAALASLFSVLALAALFVVVAGWDRVVARLAVERRPAAIFEAFRPWLILTLIVWTAGSALAAWSFVRRSRTNGVVALALSAVVGSQVAIAGYDAFRETRSSADLVKRAEIAYGRALDNDVPVYQVGKVDYTLSFLLNRTTTVVAFGGELAPGIAAEPWKAIATEAEWLSVWHAAPQAFAVFDSDERRRFEEAGMPMRILGVDARRVLVARR